MTHSPSAPAISVVVCTHNRARLLKRALQSLANQTLPAEHREIVLVDDGSTDDTRAVAVEFSQQARNFVPIHQPNSGLGYARNAGWRATQAPLVAFLDDDAVAPPDWLELICAAFAKVDSSVAVLGGPIDPEWESPPPAWLTRDLMRWLTVFDLGAAPIITRAEPVFGGANMAFRATALHAVGGFSTALGRKGASLLSHEESAIWAELAARGWTNAYRPEIRVRHFTPTERMTIRWFRRRLYWEGISMARRESWPDSLPRRRRLRRWIGTAAARLSSADFLRPLLRPWRLHRAVQWQTYCSYHLGYLREIWLRTLQSGKSGVP